MKKAMLFLLFLSCAVFADAQSVKEALFGGKLKNGDGSVVKKGDDLSTKIDTTTRKAVVADSAKAKDTVYMTNMANRKDSVAFTPVKSTEGETQLVDTTATITETAPVKDAAAVTKDNNALWKDFVATVTNTLNTEVMSSKKIKNGTYYVTVTYAIETDGQVSVNNVLVTPENSFLQQQIKDRLSLDTPKMTPVLNSNGTPRKVNRNYSFQLNKEK